MLRTWSPTTRRVRLHARPSRPPLPGGLHAVPTSQPGTRIGWTARPHPATCSGRPPLEGRAEGPRAKDEATVGRTRAPLTDRARRKGGIAAEGSRTGPGAEKRILFSNAAVGAALSFERRRAGGLRRKPADGGQCRRTGPAAGGCQSPGPAFLPRMVFGERAAVLERPLPGKGSEGRALAAQSVLSAAPALPD